MKPCQCLIMTGDIEDDMPVAAPCGEQVADKKNFRPGHDAKLKSTLIKAFRNGGSLASRRSTRRFSASSATCPPDPSAARRKDEVTG